MVINYGSLNAGNYGNIIAKIYGKVLAVYIMIPLKPICEIVMRMAWDIHGFQQNHFILEWQRKRLNTTILLLNLEKV